MFKKLKEKIIEEVNFSPQRFGEFTQSLNDRLQSNSTSDDNFFSIGDDDANSSVDNNSYGFSSVQLVSPSQERPRKSSVSSLASDVSFLPKYEPGSMYHLQSDLDISASEVEDNVSTSSSQLGHLTKEQIYSAFQKSQMRYHKYRGRYTDLSRHYKDLEREILKMKSVLVETQDKAIRRVTELKEQCNLEQKAKAHLEGALRDEIDEKNYKIKTLQTQIGLLQNDHSINQLVNVDNNINNSSGNLENLTKVLNESRKEIENLNSKIQELKANTIVFQSKEHEYKSKISNFEKEIVQFSEREKENNLNLAQNKMELHNEILFKDSEISNLRRDNESLKQKLELSEVDSKSNANQKMENLQSQNTKLIEKVESLTQKSNNLESELIKMQTYKIEIEKFKQKHEDLEEQIKQLEKLNEDLCKSNSQLKETLENEKGNNEKQISQLRENAQKGLLSLEPTIRQKLALEFSEKEKEIREEFSAKLEEMSSVNNTTKELQLKLFDNEILIKKLSEQLTETNSEINKKREAYNNLETNHLELIEDSTKLRDTISHLEKDKLAKDSCDEKIARLEAHINTLQTELKSTYEVKSQIEETLIAVKETLANTNEQLNILEEQNIQLKSENTNAQLKLNSKDAEKEKLTKTIEDLTEKVIRLEQSDSEDSINKSKVQELEYRLSKEKDKFITISREKDELINKLKEIEEKYSLMEIKLENLQLEKTECNILQLKLQKLEEEHELLNKEYENQKELTEEITKKNKKVLKKIEKDYANLNEQYENERVNNEFSSQKLRELEEEIIRKTEESKTVLQEFNTSNKIITLAKEEKEKEVLELSSKISSLVNTIEKQNVEFHNLLAKTDELNAAIDNVRTEKYIQEQLNSKIGQLEKELDQKSQQIIALTQNLSELENVCKEEKKNADKTIEECRGEYVKIEAELKNSNYYLKAKDNELSILDNEITSLRSEIETLKQESSDNNLQLKLQKLEKDYEQLQQAKEFAEETSKENKKVIQILENEYAMVSEQYENEKRNYELSNQKLQELEQEIIRKSEESKIVLQEFITANEKLTIAKEEKEKEISELSTKLGNFNELLKKTQELDTALENVSIEKLEAIKLEKFQQEKLNSKIVHLEKELEQKSQEIIILTQNLSELDNLSKDKKKADNVIEKFKGNYERIEAELKAKDNEISILHNEKSEYNSLRLKLQQLETDHEQLQQDKDFANEISKENKKVIEKLEQDYAKLTELYENEKIINESTSKKIQELETLKQKIHQQEQLNLKIDILEKELEQKSKEITILTQNLSDLNNVFKEEKKKSNELVEKYQGDCLRIESDLKDKINHSNAKDNDISILNEERDRLVEKISSLRSDIEEMTNEISKKGNLDTKLFHSEKERESLQIDKEKIKEEISELNSKIEQLSLDNRNISEENQTLSQEKEELTLALETLKQHVNGPDVEKLKLSDTVVDLKKQISQLQSKKERNLSQTNELDIAKIQQDFYDIKEKCDDLFIENKSLKLEYNVLEEKCNSFGKIKGKLETQINDLERQYNDLIKEKQLLQDEVQELKTAPVSYRNDTSRLDNVETLKKEQSFLKDSEKQHYLRELESLGDKLTKYKSLDITNKSSIEFYENELQKMKNQNDKLNRKLDETIVTLNHCAELSTSTEVEYLKNVLYNYMLGKESLVLARVIAAVCKFDPEQTELILQKEQQKQTLLGHLGLI